ncbi:FG-GAP-like repeat-containing protein [Marinicella rhabdoformis]|uniref:FG-GAP-like repeat-containing protein n=1 Tax=Marinicella rhabdoformis TaxID=2580566 RepID=UPI0012AED056
MLKHDADGFYDLLAINDSEDLVIQIGNGDGTFSSPSVIPLDFTPVSIALGDVDGDGLKDLLVIDDSGDLSLSLNEGLGSFGDETVIDVGLVLGESIVDVVVGHLDDDGLLDVFVAINGLLNARVALFENDGNGGFLSRVDLDFGLLASALSVDVDDVNGDGAGDIMVKGLLGSVYSMLSDGLGGLSLPSLSIAGLPTGNIYFADFNNDGVPDMVALDEVLGLVTLRLGLGDGSYGSGTSVSVGLLPSDLVMVDINGDGSQDVISVNIGDSSLNVLLGDGLGGLVNAVGGILDDLLGVIGGLGVNLPVAVVSADFNGDCRWDLAIWSDLNNEYIITLNQSGPDSSDLIFCSVFEDQSVN